MNRVRSLMHQPFPFAFVLSIICCTSSIAAPPSNDECSAAILLQFGQPVDGDTAEPTPDSAPYCDVYKVSPDVWYEIVGDGTVLNAIPCGAQAQSQVAIYCGGCDELACIQCPLIAPINFPGLCTTSPLRWCSRTGEHYWLRVFNTTTGFTLQVNSTGIPCADATDCVYDPPPSNDLCVNAMPITGEGRFEFDNTFATVELPHQYTCDATWSTSPERDLWYCWTATCDGPVTVETCGETTVDTEIVVYPDCTCASSQTACNNDACGYQSRLGFLAVAGQNYGIQVGSRTWTLGGQVHSEQPANPRNQVYAHVSRAAQMSCEIRSMPSRALEENAYPPAMSG